MNLSHFLIFLELPEIDPLVDLVGKAISTHKPKGMFMHGVQTDDHPKI